MKRPRNPKKLPMLTVANAGSIKGERKSITEKGRGAGGMRDRTVRIAITSNPSIRKAQTRMVHGKPI
jgi:hypothetical protein